MGRAGAASEERDRAREILTSFAASLPTEYRSSFLNRAELSDIIAP
jgi:hypothetical protein